MKEPHETTSIDTSIHTKTSKGWHPYFEPIGAAQVKSPLVVEGVELFAPRAVGRHPRNLGVRRVLARRQRAAPLDAAA